eukprot:m.1014106 g.1014106  ORF g.1014106 m.1014106 type:complete len:88 (-) comp24068_c0_seq40:462-725(-)
MTHPYVFPWQSYHRANARTKTRAQRLDRLAARGQGDFAGDVHVFNVLSRCALGAWYLRNYLSDAVSSCWTVFSRGRTGVDSLTWQSI